MPRQYQTSFGCYQIRPEKIDKNNIEFLSGPWTLASFSGPITERKKGKPKQIRVTATLNLRLLQTTKRGITIKCQTEMILCPRCSIFMAISDDAGNYSKLEVEAL